MNGFGSYPLNIGTLVSEGITEIQIPEGYSQWMIKKRKLLFIPNSHSEYAQWEDTGWEDVPYMPHGDRKDNGWEYIPDWARRLEVYAAQKKVKVGYRLIFIGDIQRLDIEKSQ